MILPDNGKVVIIDDKIDDVIELISGLSSERIPFVYYKDELGDDLPSEPLNNVRILFLDLLLIDDNRPPVKNVISTLITRIKKIIPKNNGPYILIYFSSTRRIYGKAFERELAKKKLKDYRPFLTLSISKPTNITKVKSELQTKFNNFKSMKAFLTLESVTNKATSKVINHFSDIFSVDGTWDKNLKDVLYKTGEARVGEVNFKTLGNEDKVKNALLSLSSTLDENIDREINNLNFSEISFDPLVKYDTTEEAKAKFNSRLHLFELNQSVIKSGVLYFLRKNKSITDEILDKLRDPKKTSAIESKLFFIDLTPICDYSQDKKYVRGVYGIMVSKSDEKNFKNSRPAFSKFSPIIFHDDDTRRLILDYRFSKSILLSEFEKLKFKPVFRISNELLIEFQSDFAKHISRPGYISIY
jgi:hypothetical protein